ncbi:hypothetical protein [Streptomyces sp. NPDC048142]|uniref:hypothetical protein n=1 Tax=Streptomyces sp. NPDC048142 TaxID=3365501 RepID=UPI003715A9FD
MRRSAARPAVLRCPPLLVLVAVGLVAGRLPGVPTYHLDAHFVPPLRLPPSLHTAALDSSYPDGS